MAIINVNTSGSLVPGGSMFLQKPKFKKPKLVGLLKAIGNKVDTLNGRLLLNAPVIEEVVQSSGDIFKGVPEEKQIRFAHDGDSAHLVSSLTMKGTHKPTLDIDMPCTLEESATPGKFHLFIDRELTTEQYDELLKVLVNVGIVQKGVYDLQFQRQGFTAVRLPGISKLVYKDGKKVALKKPGTYTKDSHELSSDSSSPFG